MSTAHLQQNSGLSSGVVSSRTMVWPGGIQIGGVHATSDRISHPTIVSKTTGSTLTASELVGSMILVAGNTQALTLNIPTANAIIAAFAFNNQLFSAGDQFEVDIAHLVGAGADLTLAAAVVALENSVTFASGAPPTHLTAALGAKTHFVKLIFEVTSPTAPNIKVHCIVG